MKEHAIKFSYPVARDNPIGLGVTRFGELVNQKSGNTITVKGYSDAQLGSEIQSLSSAQGGVLEMAVVSTAGAAATLKEFALFDLPFLFADENEADATLDGPVGHYLAISIAGGALFDRCVLAEIAARTTDGIAKHVPDRFGSGA